MKPWPIATGKAATPSANACKSRDDGCKWLGVAKDSKYSSVRENPKPFFFLPLRQNNRRGSALFVRTPLGQEVMGPAIAREVRALDANLAPYEVITLQEELE